MMSSITVRFLLFLFLIGTTASTAVAQETSTDPRQILLASSGACMRVQTASYAARYVRHGSREVAPILVEASITVARNEQDKDLGAQTRISFVQGVTYTYNGDTLGILMPEAKTVVIASAADRPGSIIAADLAGMLVKTPMIEDVPFGKALAPNSEVEYVGGATVEGVACDVVTVRRPDDAYITGLETRWYVGREDRLPRRRESQFVFDGNTIRDTLTLTDLRTNLEVDSRLFATRIPTDFIVEPYGSQSRRSKLKAAGEEAPNWTLTNDKGEEISLADLHGNVVVLDFWATWCGPCVMAMPGVQKLHERFKDRNVRVFGVDCFEREGAEPVRFLREKGYTYGLLLNGEEVAVEYGVTGIPTFYVIGTDGSILYSASGFNPNREEEIGALIERHLNGGGY